MKRISFIYGLLSLAVVSCGDAFGDAVDFTEVENPNLTQESVVGQPNSSRIWLSGLDRQMGLVYNEILILAELGSDNYVNTQTFYSQFLDALDIRTTDPDIRDTQLQIARLRVSAIFGLEQVGPGDSEYTPEIEAEYHFYEGVSYLLAGMYFSALPQEEGGVPVSSTDNLTSAVMAFDEAISFNAMPEYHLAKARAHYFLGQKTEAVAAATAALALDDSFARQIRYDAANGPVNNMESALYGRATFDDFQPLPTLDFLDPKYSFLSPAEDAPVHFLKAEEAHMIIAEGNIADGAFGAAQGNMTDLLALVGTREVRTIDDSIEGRIEVAPGSRPDNTGVVVNGRSGLVLDRQAGLVNVPSVSGTSLTAGDIATMSDEDTALYLLYRTRQEVFISEGMRFVDMGIKLVLHENEILQNENVSDGDPSTVPVIPSFINAVVADLDAITYDAGAGVATTVIDVTDILVTNKTAAEVLPFH